MEYLNQKSTETFTFFLKTILDEFIKWFGDIYKISFFINIDIINQNNIKNMIFYIQLISITFLLIKIIIYSIQTYILYSNGDDSTNIKDLLINSIKSIAIITSIPFILNYIIKAENLISKDIILLNKFGEYENNSVFLKLLEDNSMPTIIIILLLITFTLMLIIYLQTIIRSAELVLISILGPILAINIITNETKYIYNKYLKYIIILMLSQIIQVFMFKLSFLILNSSNGTNIQLILIFLSWIWVTFKAPYFIKKVGF